MLGSLVIAAAAGLGTPTPPPQQVIGGEEAPGEPFEAVVAVKIGGDLCTGVLIEPDLVLTAGHCLDEVSDASNIRVTNAATSSGPTVAVTQFGVHPFICLDCGVNEYDYGYVVLAEPFEGVEPIEVLANQTLWDQLIGAGTLITIAGYGAAPDQGEDEGTRRQVVAQINRILDSGLEFTAGGDGRDSCGGDSGGPALIVVSDGSWRLVGLTSRGSQPCGNGGFYAVAYHGLQWVASETGRPLCGEGCPSCTCLDTTPADDEQGCGCREGSGGLAALWVGLLALGLRRRARPSVASK